MVAARIGMVVVGVWMAVGVWMVRVEVSGGVEQ